MSRFFLREGLGLVVAAGLGGAICMFPTDLRNNKNNAAGWKSLELCGKSGNVIGIDQRGMEDIGIVWKIAESDEHDGLSRLCWHPFSLINAI